MPHNRVSIRTLAETNDIAICEIAPNSTSTDSISKLKLVGVAWDLLNFPMSQSYSQTWRFLNLEVPPGASPYNPIALADSTVVALMTKNF